MIGTESFSVEQTGDITIVRIVDTRDFDTDNHAQFRQDLVDLVAQQQPKNLLVDLSRLVYLSTALTNSLLIAQKRMQSRAGALRLFGLTETVLETLQRLSLIGSVLSVYADEEAAKQACG